MAKRFLSNINVNDQYTLPAADGATGQVIQTDGAGNLSFVDFSSEEARKIVFRVKNKDSISLSKGTVVHASPSANPPSGNIVEVIRADNDDSTKMPAIGVLNETLAVDAEGECVVIGSVTNIATNSFTAGDFLYVSDTPGEFTNTKPTGINNLIQKIGIVVKSHATNGSVEVVGTFRSNDVPNAIDRDLTLTGNADLFFEDGRQIRMGNTIGSPGLRIQHTGSHSYIDGEIGNMYFRTEANDSDLIFQADNGAGGNATYFQLDGSAATHDGVNTTALYTWWGDNSRIALGASKDLQIYHDSTHSYIYDAGTGRLNLRTNQFRVVNAANSEIIIDATENGAVKLYYDNSLKFETLIAGVKVTGDTTTTGHYFADTHFRSTDSNVTLSATGSGGVYLRPDGFDQTSSQVVIAASTGDATFSGNISLPDNIFVGQSNSTDNYVKIFHSDNTYTEIHGYGIISDRTSYYLRPVNDGTQTLYLGSADATKDWSSIQAKFTTDVDFVQNGTNRFTIDSSGIHVAGGAFISGNIDFSTNGSDISMKDSAGALTRVLVLNSSNTTYIGPVDSYAGGSSIYGASSNHGNHDLYVGGTRVLRVESSGINVVGNANISGSYLINDTSIISTSSTYTQLRNPEGTICIYLGDSANRTNYYDNNVHTFRNFGSSTTYAVLNSTGLGIGTTSPDEKLVVYGSVNNDDIAIKIKNTYDDNTVGSAPASALILESASNNGYIRLTGSPADVASEHILDIGSTATGNEITFTTQSTERVRIDASGNVGIGTSSPSYKLEVNGIAKIHNGIITDVGVPLKMIVNNGALNDSTELRTGSGEFKLYSGRYNSTHQAFVFATGDNYTSGSERMRITSGGRVGIGTTNPTTYFQVNSGTENSVAIFESTDANAHIRVVDINATVRIENNSGKLILGADLDSQQADSYISFEIDGASEKMRIDSSGNVGIGTTSPTQSKLVVDGTISIPRSQGFQYLESISGAFRAGIFSTDTNATGVGFNSLRFFVNSDSTNPAMVIGGSTNTKNVGIGETSPDAKLHIKDDSVAQLYIERTGSITGTYRLGIAGANNKFYISDIAQGQDRLIISNNGNIGIGIGSPTQKLHVAGNLRVTGAYYDSNNSSGTADQVLVSTGTGTDWQDLSDISGVDGTGASGQVAVWSDTDTITGYTRFKVYDAGGQIQVTDGTRDIRINSGYGGSTAMIGTVGSHNLGFMTANSQRVTIDSSGSVGIGTTSPTSKLQVDGDFNINNKYIYNQGVVTTTGAGTANGVALTWKSGTTAINTAYNYRVRLTTTGTGTNSGATYLVEYNPDDTTYNVRMVTRSGSTSNHPLLAMSGANMIAYTNHASAYNIQYHTEAISVADNDGTLHNMGADYHWQRDVNDLFYEDGNVGIGTDSPGAKLQVNGSTSDATASAFIVRNSSLTSLFSIRNDGRVDVPSGAIVHSGGGYANTSTNDSYFTGDVGIGTTSPSYKLDVEHNGNATNGIQVTNTNSGTSSRATVVLVSEDAQLNIYATSSNYNVVASWADAAVLSTSGATSNGLIFNAQSGGIKFQTATTERMRIDSSGNVGIGKTPSTWKLDVDSSDIYAASFDTSNNVGIVINGNNTTAAQIIGYSNSASTYNELHLRTNSTTTDGLYINSSGNVGIGTTSPAEKLDVAGRVKITSSGGDAEKIIGTKNQALTENTFTTVLTVNMSDHTGCYVKIVAFGDWNSHSSVQYLGEFFLTHGAGSYNEPGMIIREVDNTATDTIVAQIVQPAGTTGNRDFVIQLKADDTIGTSGVTARITYEVMGQFNSVT